MFLINRAHERRRGWQDLINKDKDGFLRAELDPFADHIDKLAHCEVGRHQILLLVDGRNIGFLNLFANHLKILSVVLMHGALDESQVFNR